MNRSPIALARNATNSCPINNSLLSTADALSTSKRSAATNGQLKNTIIMTNHTDGSSYVKNADIAANVIRLSNIVCFDVDSTVIQEEGIDELADFCGKGDEVARVTKEAMGGSMKFQDALKKRLNIIQPTCDQILDFVKLRPSTLTKGVKQFISHLKANGKQVYLISGGFHSLIDPVATKLGIPTHHVFANKLNFYGSGDYANFDTNEPTCRTGGKGIAVAIIKKMNPSAIVTMIGDGMTDFEAVPPANYFIGFGGNVVRPEVFNNAPFYVTEFDQLWSQDE